MWVGILIVGLAMRGPAGVAHPNVTVQRLTFDELFKLGDLALLFVHIEAVVHQGNARTVIAAVLQAL